MFQTPGVSLEHQQDVQTSQYESHRRPAASGATAARVPAVGGAAQRGVHVWSH